MHQSGLSFLRSLAGQTAPATIYTVEEYCHKYGFTKAIYWYVEAYDIKVVWLTIPLDPEINN
eukprot:12907325-Prorocentrum_lima.AAC.1